MSQMLADCILFGSIAACMVAIAVCVHAVIGLERTLDQLTASTMVEPGAPSDCAACQIRQFDGVCYLQGRLTAETCPSMRPTVDGLLRHTAPRQVIDMSALHHIDSAGLGMLLIAAEEMSRVNQRLVLRAAAGQVRRALEMAHLGTQVTIED